MNKNAKYFYLALVSFLCSQLLLAGILSFTGKSYFSCDTWNRYDSGLYLWIAEKGYVTFPCDEQNIENDVTEFCGNAGWFPGYPYLIKLFAFTDNTALIGILLSRLFLFLSLFLMAKILKPERFEIRSILLMLIAAFFFGFIYYNSIFPISAVTFFALSAFYFYHRQSLFPAFIACFLATLFYPTGFLLGLSLILYIVFNRKEQWFNHIILFGAAVAGGALLVCINYQLTVGDWMAFTKVQDKYGHGFNNPLSNMLNLVFHSPYLKKGEIRIFIYLQAILVLLYTVVVSLLVFKKKLLTDDICRWAYIYFILYFVFEWSIAGDLSMYRSDALLLPSVLLFKDSGRNFLIAVLTVLLLIGIPMSYLFFESILV